MKIYIASSRPVGDKCLQWAEENFPNFEYVDNIADADLLISVLYRNLLKKEDLDHLKIAFNFHVGLLPEYRGSATNIWAIVNGEKFTGITLHVIDEGIDTGDIIEAFPLQIAEDDTGETLLTKCENLIFEVFKSWFWRLTQGTYERMPQRGIGHTYYRKDLEKLKDITNLIRALSSDEHECAYFKARNGRKVYFKYE